MRVVLLPDRLVSGVGAVFLDAVLESEQLPGFGDRLLARARERRWTFERLLRGDDSDGSDNGQRRNVAELFDLLLVETMSAIGPPADGKPVALLIDALDECEYRGRNKLLKLLRRKLGELPTWARLVVTTRPSGGAGGRRKGKGRRKGQSSAR